MWRDHGDGPWGYVWRPSLLLVGLVAVVVAAPTTAAQRLGALTLGATVLRIAVLPVEVDRLPATGTPERWSQALADVAVGALLIAAVFSALRSRRRSRGAREFLDGLAVASGGVLIAWVTLANPAQILTTQQTVEALSPPLREQCRQLFPIRVRGRHEEIIACSVRYRSDPDATETNIARATLTRERDLLLKITYQGEMRVVRSAGAGLRIGREKDNDLVVESHFASRQHARIYPREGHFVLQDLSSNGTYLLQDGTTAEILLRREEAVLGERGWIGLGNSATRHGDHAMRFRIEREGD